MRDDPSVVALVARASGSDPGAWDEIAERNAGLRAAFASFLRGASSR